MKNSWKIAEGSPRKEMQFSSESFFKSQYSYALLYLYRYNIVISKYIYILQAIPSETWWQRHEKNDVALASTTISIVRRKLKPLKYPALHPAV